ncbi:MAG: transposase, partial [Proteobacteria bacterium]|nr:transposase [Pseudomonadota bacterium]
ITDSISIPVGFDFYEPDPELKAWKKNDKKLRKNGVSKKHRPPELKRNPNYPTVPEIALALLRQFRSDHLSIRIDCILADALYGTRAFLDEASAIFGGVQVISQIKKNQNVLFRGKKIHGKRYFSSYPGVNQAARVRGGKKQTVIVGSARLHVCSHGKKRFVIALKYEGEEEYRYIVATDMSWRTLDIVEAYSLRWLIEVFFEDWKISEGWGRLTKHTGEKGSRRGVILSLLTDHCLFFHPDQKALIDDNLPACTVGSLIRQIRIECFMQFVKDMVSNA